jgi:hypothetical protein
MEVLMYSVYALCDPRTDEIKYIGCSSKVQQRYQEHLSDNRTNQSKWAWICELRDLGLSPKLAIIEENLDKKKRALIQERYWLQVYIEAGAVVTNMRDAELLDWELRPSHPILPIPVRRQEQWLDLVHRKKP